MQISKDESLKLFGLFMLATEHYDKAREYEFAINRSLGRDGDDQAQVSDAIYARDGKATAEDFFRALKLEGVEIIE